MTTGSAYMESIDCHTFRLSSADLYAHPETVMFVLRSAYTSYTFDNNYVNFKISTQSMNSENKKGDVSNKTESIGKTEWIQDI